jgi:hypothetical protein
MADPILTPAAPPVIAVQTPSSNGDNTGASNDGQFFGAQMQEAINKAFEEARPDPYKKPSPAREIKPTEPAPVKEIKEVESPEQPKASTPRAAQWKEVNEERERLKKENETFKTEREKWKQWESERQEYESVKKEHDTFKKHNQELLDRIQTIALEKDPRFENHFKSQTDTAISLAKQAVGPNHSERVAALLQMPDSEFRTQQLDEIQAELGRTQSARLGAAIVRMDEIMLSRNSALAKSKENWEAMQKADREQQTAQRQKLDQTFQKTLSKWQDKESGIPLFQLKDGDETHNAGVQERVKRASEIFNMKVDAEEFSKAVMWAASAPGLLKDLIDRETTIKTLNEELKALKSGGPELNGGSDRGDSPVEDEKEYEGLSYGEIIAKKAVKAGAWQR